MLELHEAAAAFDELERYLEDERFAEREDVVADLYLGYGLSAAIRRETTPLPPEPCALPLLACRIRPVIAEGHRATRRGSDSGNGSGPGRTTGTRPRSRRRARRSRAGTCTRSTSSSIFPRRSRAIRTRSPQRSRRCGRSRRSRSAATAGRSSPRRPSCSSPAAGGASGRCRSRGRGRLGCKRGPAHGEGSLPST